PNPLRPLPLHKHPHSNSLKEKPSPLKPAPDQTGPRSPGPENPDRRKTSNVQRSTSNFQRKKSAAIRPICVICGNSAAPSLFSFTFHVFTFHVSLLPQLIFRKRPRIQIPIRKTHRQRTRQHTPRMTI